MLTNAKIAYSEQPFRARKQEKYCKNLLKTFTSFSQHFQISRRTFPSEYQLKFSFA